ncbi:hypothetical protein [Rhodococcus sp. H29-C3]|uniref:hypothetical protein n=1 Tax=Rhodococcus sp. H29-C3 TaxID=3046307 RepID=UPI0024BAE783|nr:hypothetical protein [Rhodococcus sp. H29-C3]MDJ0360687.1 hypothetical protein [Rhodococcus sp. H29-C3]
MAHFLSLQELRDRTDNRDLRQDFGPWRLFVGPEYGDGKTFAALVLVRNVNYTYEVDLARTTTSQEILSWIAHISAKNWASPEIISGLVKALDAVLSIQGGVSLGSSRLKNIARAEAFIRNHPEIEHIQETESS